MFISVSIENPLYLRELLPLAGIDGIYLPSDRLAPSSWAAAAAACHRAGKRAYLALPWVMRREAGQYLLAHEKECLAAAFDGFLVRNTDEAGFLTERKWPGEKIFDAGMYSWNREAAAVMRSLGADVLTLPYECRKQEWDILGYEGKEMVVYGRLPVMISAQCARKTGGNCLQAGGGGDLLRFHGFYELRDRKGAKFLQDSHCLFCYNVIYNSVPLWLADRIPAACGRIRFAFTDEGPEAAAALIASFRQGKGKPALYTRGHFTRGVE